MSFSNEKDFHDDFYDQDADKIYESAAFSLVKKQNVKFILSQIPNSTLAKVLSVGCGNGLLECMIAPHVSELIASDLSPKAIEIANLRAAKENIKNVKFEVGAAGKLSYPDASFDAVLMLSLLHHIDEASIDYLLREANRVLKPGGVVISADPSKYRLAGVFRFVFEKTFRKYHSPDERELSPSWLKLKFSNTGFYIPKIHRIDFFYNPFCWVFPSTPLVIARVLSQLDRLLLMIPLLNKLCSGFSIVAIKGKQD